jgi:hypothetical protein
MKKELRKYRIGRREEKGTCHNKRLFCPEDGERKFSRNFCIGLS